VKFGYGMPRYGVIAEFVVRVDDVDGHPESDLASMGDRLSLPQGWSYKSKVLDRELVIDTSGLANIVPDKLSNMYQGCIDRVNNFDP
jgi:hypothetical protein